MNSISIRDAQARLPDLLRNVSSTHMPVEIADEHYSGILVSTADWSSIQETLHLLAVPGMRESIREGMGVSLSECTEEVW